MVKNVNFYSCAFLNKKLMKKTSLLKGTLYIGISHLVFILSGYIINVWLARHLGPNNYGIYGIIISFVTIINICLTGGLSQAISKFCSENETLANSIKNSILKILIPFSSIIAIICFFLAPIIAGILKDNKLINFIRVSVLIIPLFTIYAIYIGYFNGIHLFNKQSYLLILYSSLKLVFIILLSIYFGLYGSIIGFVFALLGTILLGISFSEKGKSDYFNHLKIIKFAFPIIINSIFLVITMNLGLLMTKSILINNKLVGYYNASVTLTRAPYFLISGVIGSIMLPAVSSSIKKQHLEKTKNLINRWIKFSLIIVLPITFLSSFTSSTLINLFYSEQYSPSARPFSILIYGMMFFGIFTILSAILKGAGKPYIPMIIISISLILNFILNIYLIPEYQLIGAAISTSISGLLAIILISYLIFKEFGVLISIRSFLKIISASLLISIPTIFISLPKILLPIEYMLFFGIYFLILYFLKEIKKEDIDKIRGAIISFIPWV